MLKSIWVDRRIFSSHSRFDHRLHLLCLCLPCGQVRNHDNGMLVSGTGHMSERSMRATAVDRARVHPSTSPLGPLLLLPGCPVPRGQNRRSTRVSCCQVGSGPAQNPMGCFCCLPCSTDTEHLDFIGVVGCDNTLMDHNCKLRSVSRVQTAT